MRTLTIKQKKLLDVWYNKNCYRIKNGIIAFDWSDCEYFPLSLFEELERINDTEILSQEVNRYISDKGMEEAMRAK